MRVAGTVHSFLFTDLVGFTALAARDGDDRAAEVAIGFYEHVRALLDEHGAEEVKTIGDALMLRCDRADHAMRLGAAIVRELDETPGFPPVRVGIHTGPAVQRANDWYGTTVNVAARLCSAAAGGQVLASEATRHAAGRVRDLDFGDRRLHWLKNVTEPVAAHLVEQRAHACPIGSLTLPWRRQVTA